MTTTDIAPTGFDYAALDPAVAAEAQRAATNIRTRLRVSVVETGRDLLAVKEKLPHGAFGAWLDSELQMGVRSAENYMAYARFVEGKNEKFSFLPPSAIYALAAPSVPAEVIADVEQALEIGIVPKVAEVREWIANASLFTLDHTPAPPKPAPAQPVPPAPVPAPPAAPPPRSVQPAPAKVLDIIAKPPLPDDAPSVVPVTMTLTAFAYNYARRKAADAGVTVAGWCASTIEAECAVGEAVAANELPA